MSLLQIHTGLSNACVMFSLLMGGYSLWRFARKQGVGGNLWGILAAAQVLYVAQGVVGGLVFLTLPAHNPGWRWVHILYGVVLLIGLPGAYAYMRGKDDQHAALIYGLMGLFLAGVSLRAIGTAG